MCHFRRKRDASGALEPYHWRQRTSILPGNAIQQDLNHVADLLLFAHIVQSGGISRCADMLGMERTTVSRRLKNLENHLETPLLVRSPNQMTTTKAGRRCFQKCMKILEIVDSVGVGATNNADFPVTASVVVAAPADIVESCLQPKLDAYEKANPDTEIRRQLLSASTIDGDLSLVDLLVTWQTATKIDAQVRKLASVNQSIYASPAFIESNGYPNRPADLHNVKCIVVGSLRDNDIWKFSHHGATHGVKVERHFDAATLFEARAAAIAGIGCCQIPASFGEPFVRCGRLVKVLTNFKTNKRNLVTATPETGPSRRSVTLLRLFLEAAFASAKSANLVRLSVDT